MSVSVVEMLHRLWNEIPGGFSYKKRSEENQTNVISFGVLFSILEYK